MPSKILLVDDEPAICNLVKLHFQTEGYLVYTASDAEEAAQMLSLTPDLILLDINMPEVDGLDFCKKIRSHIDCPIIFLTSRVTEQDKITGLRAGGDDYITKPFSLDELTARVEAHLRREKRARYSDTKMFGDLFIDYAGRCVYCNEQIVPFSKKEFDIIEFLSLNAGQVFDRERIYERLWGYDAEGSSDILKEHIRRIRVKLEKVSDKSYIETVWGCGYKWVS
ncbi:response regulator transcription factor [Acutalibacter muris]|jgi:DNA-binding response OmpR family regulator|uniref:response regulator transcription factor n=1 Tax=Acutalibacter muris TaxID=1796620 RepID=UPI0026F390BE|nr:response regulator transcription factor [Acutalibacter muris]